MEKEIISRFQSAVMDMNNFQDGEFELPQNIELEGELEIVSVSLDGSDQVKVTPKHSIWGDAYSLHRFALGIESLSDSVISEICDTLEQEVREQAAWWDIEE